MPETAEAAWELNAKRFTPLYTFQIFARPCIDFDDISLVDEHRHLDFGAGFNGGGLGGVGGGVAFHARLGMGNLQLDKHRRLD